MNKSTTMQEIRSIIKEITVIQQETSEQIKRQSAETTEQIKRQSAEADKQIKELRASQKKTSQQIKELRASQKETTEQMKDTDKKLNRYIGEAGHRWGKLGENLVKGALVQKLKKRGIKVKSVTSPVNHDLAEFDIVAENGKEVVVVEVKTTLKTKDVFRFKYNLQRFKTLFPHLKEKTIYGAMAFLLRANEKTKDIVKEEGFFLISATGDVIIENKENFKPKVFN